MLGMDSFAYDHRRLEHRDPAYAAAWGHIRTMGTEYTPSSSNYYQPLWSRGLPPPATASGPPNFATDDEPDKLPASPSSLHIGVKSNTTERGSSVASVSVDPRREGAMPALGSLQQQLHQQKVAGIVTAPALAIGSQRRNAPPKPADALVMNFDAVNGVGARTEVSYREELIKQRTPTISAPAPVYQSIGGARHPSRTPSQASAGPASAQDQSLVAPQLRSPEARRKDSPVAQHHNVRPAVTSDNSRGTSAMMSREPTPHQQAYQPEAAVSDDFELERDRRSASEATDVVAHDDHRVSPVPHREAGGSVSPSGEHFAAFQQVHVDSHTPLHAVVQQHPQRHFVASDVPTHSVASPAVKQPATPQKYSPARSPRQSPRRRTPVSQIDRRRDEHRADLLCGTLRDATNRIVHLNRTFRELAEAHRLLHDKEIALRSEVAATEVDASSTVAQCDEIKAELQASVEALAERLRLKRERLDKLRRDNARLKRELGTSED